MSILDAALAAFVFAALAWATTTASRIVRNAVDEHRRGIWFARTSDAIALIFLSFPILGTASALFSIVTR